MPVPDPSASPRFTVDLRQFLYGLISGVVLVVIEVRSVAEDSLPYWPAIFVIASLVVLGLAHAYVHAIATPLGDGAQLRRTVRESLRDAAPIMVAGLVPGLILLVLGVLGMASLGALRVTLVLTLAVIAAVAGWVTRRTGAPWSRVVSAVLVALVAGVAVTALEFAVAH